MRKVHLVLVAIGLNVEFVTTNLQVELNLSTICINELFIETLIAKNHLSVVVQSYLDSGELVPSSIINEMIVERASSIQTSIQIVRYPSTKAQFESLNGFLIERGIEIEQIWILKLRNFEELKLNKSKYEKDNLYFDKFGSNEAKLRTNYFDNLKEFEEIEQLVSDDKLVTTINLEYPIENSRKEIFRSISKYIEKRKLG